MTDIFGDSFREIRGDIGKEKSHGIFDFHPHAKKCMLEWSTGDDELAGTIETALYA